MKFIWSERLFRLMLHLYPAQYRAEYGEAMAQHFHDMCRQAYQGDGKRSLINVWLKVVNDTLRNAPVEQWTAIRTGGIMRKQTVGMIGLALLGSLLVGTIDSHASEVQATLMVMLPITFALGFIQPKRAWLWALMVGLSVPLSFLWLSVTGQRYTAPPSNGFTTLIALVPAFIGTYSGVVLRKIFSQAAIPTA